MFRCSQCHKVQKAGVKPVKVVTHNHRVLQYDYFHKREVETYEIAREVLMCEVCGNARTGVILGKLPERPETANKEWLVEAIEQAQADEVE